MIKMIFLKAVFHYYEFLSWWNESSFAETIRQNVYSGMMFVLKRIEHSPRLDVAVIAKLLRDWLENYPPD